MMRRLLLEILLLRKPEEDADKQNIQYSKQGPGQLDAYLAVLEEEPACWIDHLPKSTKQSKPHVYLGHNPFQYRAPFPCELRLISQLIEHTNLCIWPQTGRPLANLEDFWGQVNTLESAATSQMKEALADRGLSPQNDSFLDYNSYSGFLARYRELKSNAPHLFPASDHEEEQFLGSQGPDRLDLSHFPLPNLTETDNYLSAIDTSQIEYLTLPLTTGLEKKKLINNDLFPHLKNIKVNASIPSTIEKLNSTHQPYLSLTKTEIVSAHPFPTAILPSHFINLIQSEIPSQDTPQNPNFHLSKDRKRLTLNNYQLPIDFRQFPELEELNISFTFDPNTSLDLSHNPNLVLLNINHSTFDSLQLSRCPNLRRIKLNHVGLRNGNLSHLPQLSEASLHLIGNNEINLSNNTALRRLEYQSANIEDETTEKQATVIKLNLDGCANLTDLNLDICDQPELFALAFGSQPITAEAAQPGAIYTCLDENGQLTLKYLKTPGKFKKISLEAAFSEMLQGIFSDKSAFKQLPPGFHIFFCTRSLDETEVLPNAVYIFMEKGKVKGTGRNPSDNSIYTASDVESAINISQLVQLFDLMLPFMKHLISQDNDAYQSHLRIQGIENLKVLQAAKIIQTRNSSIELSAPFSKSCDLDMSEHNLPVSYFSPTGQVAPDTRTGPKEGGKEKCYKNYKKNYKDHNSKESDNYLTYNLRSHDNVDLREYRLQVLDDITYDEVNGDLFFTSSIPAEEDLVLITDNPPGYDEASKFIFTKKVSKEKGVGTVQGKIKPNTLYALGAIEAQNNLEPLEFLSKPAGAVSIYWHRNKQQYFMRANAREEKVADEIEVLHDFSRDHAYNQPGKAKLIENTKPLSQALKNRLLADLNESNQSPAVYLEHDMPNGRKELQFLFDTKLTLEEKLEKLKHYCLQFTNDDTLGSPMTGYDNILYIILQKKGACRHRSQAFTLLARLIDAPANLIYNEIHAFADNQHEDGMHRVDSGGAPCPRIKPTRENGLIDTTIHNTPEVIDPDVEKYIKRFAELAEIQTLSSLDTLAQKSRLSPLVILNDNQQLNLFKNRLYNNQNSATTIYIPNAKSFLQYLSPKQISGGYRRRVTGPLAELIQRGGTLIVNWSQFTPTEIGQFKTILDAEPSLFEHKVSPELRVIGLMTPQTSAGSAFLSRCQRFRLAQGFNLNLGQKTPEESKAISEHLYQQPDWRKAIITKIRFCLDQIHLDNEQSLLSRAINAKQSLLVYNPPADPQFTAFVDQVNHEHRFLFNGAWQALPPDFRIETAETEVKIEAPNVHIHTQADPALLARKKIYIGLHNMHECYETLTINEQEQAQSHDKGHFDGTTVSRKLFVITSDIPYMTWQFLLNKMKAHPDKQYDFLLANGASIENIASPPKKPTIVDEMKSDTPPIEDCPSFYFSNDPELVCERLQEHDPKLLLIDISPNTDFRHLVAEQEINPETGKFKYIERGLLSALKSGRHVILRGELSPALYEKLLPLFDKPARIYLNGQFHPCPGKLIAVMPERLKEKYPLSHDAGLYQYQIEDYKKLLSEEDLPYLQLILQFLELIKSVSHEQINYPQLPKLTRQRLCNWIESLKQSSLHPHNPIKGLLHYHYPKSSIDYAYLCVASKLTFCAQDTSTVRADKLSELISKAQINENNFHLHAWQLLNCFNGKDLGDLFLNDGLIKKGQTKLIPPAEVLDRLKNKILPLILDPKPVVKKQKFDKPELQLQTLMNNPRKRGILVKGEAGGGKTFIVSKLKENPEISFKMGKENIIPWLLDKSKKRKVILLDEGNMEKPGDLEFLRGLFRIPPVITYMGIEYPLDDHMAIITGNPENFPGRYHHDVIEDCFEEIYIPKRSDDFLKQIILNPILKKFYPDLIQDEEQLEKFFNLMIKAYQLIQRYNPYLTYNSRDLKSLVLRFALLYKNKAEEVSSTQILFDACRIEFAGSINQSKKRHAFIEALAKELDIRYSKPQPGLTIIKRPGEDDLLIPSEKAYVIESIKEILMLREAAMKNKELVGHYKPGILIQGAPGLGKSTIYEAILQEMGFSRETQDPAKRYVKISAGDKHAHDSINEAIREGYFIILDEINLDDTLEAPLNPVMTGTTQTGEAIDPKLQLLGSMNPGVEDEHKPVSQALRNRLHVVHMDPYSREELELIAGEMGIPNPKAFVTAYYRTHQANARLFFSLAKDLRNENCEPSPTTVQSNSPASVNIGTNFSYSSSVSPTLYSPIAQNRLAESGLAEAKADENLKTVPYEANQESNLSPG